MLPSHINPYFSIARDFKQFFLSECGHAISQEYTSTNTMSTQDNTYVTVLGTTAKKTARVEKSMPEAKLIRKSTTASCVPSAWLFGLLQRRSFPCPLNSSERFNGLPSASLGPLTKMLNCLLENL